LQVKIILLENFHCGGETQFNKMSEWNNTCDSFRG